MYVKAFCYHYYASFIWGIRLSEFEEHPCSHCVPARGGLTTHGAPGQKEMMGPPFSPPTLKPHPHKAPPRFFTTHITCVCGCHPPHIAAQLHRRAHQQTVKAAGHSCSRMDQCLILGCRLGSWRFPLALLRNH